MSSSLMRDRGQATGRNCAGQLLVGDSIALGREERKRSRADRGPTLVCHGRYLRSERCGLFLVAFQGGFLLGRLQNERQLFDDYLELCSADPTRANVGRIAEPL